MPSFFLNILICQPLQPWFLFLFNSHMPRPWTVYHTHRLSTEKFLGVFLLIVFISQWLSQYLQFILLPLPCQWPLSSVAPFLLPCFFGLLDSSSQARQPNSGRTIVHPRKKWREWGSEVSFSSQIHTPACGRSVVLNPGSNQAIRVLSSVDNGWDQQLGWPKPLCRFFWDHIPPSENMTQGSPAWI